MKAANLLISNDGTLKIADFGLARPFKPEGEDYTSKVVTRWYRPPELFLGEKKYGPAVDMWGIGYVTMPISIPYSIAVVNLIRELRYTF